MKMFRHVLLLFASSFAGLSSAQLAPFTYQDMILLDRMSGLSVSSDGQCAIVMMRGTDMQRNRSIRSLWLKDLRMLEAPEVQLAVVDADASNAPFAPDGQSIYYLSPREGRAMQLWKTDRSGQSAAQVTRMPLDIGAYRITPDGKGAVVALSVHPVAGKMRSNSP